MNKVNFKFEFKRRRDRLSVFGVSPEFDWKVILYFSIVVFVCGAVYAFLLYKNIMGGSFFEVIDDQTQKIEVEQKIKNIDKVVDELNKRNFDETAIN